MDFGQLTVPGLTVLAASRAVEAMSPITGGNDMAAINALQRSLETSISNGASLLQRPLETPIPNGTPHASQKSSSPIEPATITTATKVRFLVALQYVRGGIHGIASTSRPYKVLCVKDSATYQELIELLHEKLSISTDHTQTPIVGIQLETGDMGVALEVEDEDSWEYALEVGASYSWSKEPLKMRVYAEAAPSPPRKVTSKEAEELIMLAAAAAKKSPEDRSPEESKYLLKEEFSSSSSSEGTASTVHEDDNSENPSSSPSKRDAVPGTPKASPNKKKSVKSEPSSPPNETKASPRKAQGEEKEKPDSKHEKKRSSVRDSHDRRSQEKQRNHDRRHRHGEKGYDTNRDIGRTSDCYRPDNSRYRDRDRRDRDDSRDRGRGRHDSINYRRHRDARSLSPKRHNGDLYSEKIYKEMQNKKRNISDPTDKATTYKNNGNYGMEDEHFIALPAKIRTQAGATVIPAVTMPIPPLHVSRPLYPNNQPKWPNMQGNNNQTKSFKAPKSVAYLATRSSIAGPDWVKYQLRNTGGPDVKVRMRDAGQFGAEWREVLGPLADNPYIGQTGPSVRNSPGLIMFFFRTRPVQQGISGFGCDVRGEVSMTFSVQGFEPGSFHYTTWNNFETGEQFLTIRFTIMTGSGYYMRGFTGNQRDYGEVEWNTADRSEAAHVSYNCGMGFRVTGPNGANLQRLTGHLLNAVKSGRYNTKMQVTFSIGSNDGCWDMLPFLQRHGAIKLDKLSSGPSGHGHNSCATEIPLKESFQKETFPQGQNAP